MKKLFFLFALNIIITVIGCSSNLPVDQKSDIKFYKRNISGGKDNGIVSDIIYFDFLSITNYIDGSKTIHDFYKIAKEYLDTVKSDNRIGTIIFLGEKSCCKLPYPSYNNPITEYELLSFGFLNDSTNKKNILTNIILSKKGKNTVLWYEIPSNKRSIDSLLKSTEPYKNGFSSAPNL
jgi:hypothetical protein